MATWRDSPDFPARRGRSRGRCVARDRRGCPGIACSAQAAGSGCPARRGWSSGCAWNQKGSLFPAAVPAWTCTSGRRLRSAAKQLERRAASPRLAAVHSVAKLVRLPGAATPLVDADPIEPPGIELHSLKHGEISQHFESSCVVRNCVPVSHLVFPHGTRRSGLLTPAGIMDFCLWTPTR